MLAPRLSLALIAVFPLSAQLLVDTYAGGAIQSGVPATTALLENLAGIALTPSGDITFTDSTQNILRRVGTSGVITTIAGNGVAGFAGDGGPAASALLNSPTVIHSDAAGNLYFFDSGNRRIRRIDLNGIITTVAGDGQAPVAGLDTTGPAISRSIGNVFSFAVDSGGNLYFSLGGDTNIYSVSADGTLGVFAQVPPVAGSLSVGLLAVDSIGGVYCFDSWTYNSPNSLLRFSPRGTMSSFTTFPAASRSGSGPGYLVSDLAGRIYTYVNGQFVRYAMDGTATPVTAPLGGAPGAIDANGNMALATVSFSTLGHQGIALYNAASGLTSYVAGNNSQPAPDGTPLRNAWFFAPIFFAFSPSGDLYIVEKGDCVIRKVGLDGVLTTFGGVGQCGIGTIPSGNAKSAKLWNPNSIAIDSQNRVWVSDDFSDLYSIAQDGTISNAITTPPGVLPGRAPQLAVDSKDRVYMLSPTSLSRRLSDGSIQSIPIPPPFGGGPAYLFGLGRDSAGNVQFSAGNSLYVVNDDGSVTVTTANFIPSLSLAFDPQGNPWGTYNRFATSNSSGLVEIWAPNGSGYAGDGGALQSAGMRPNGSIAFGPDGNLYFVDNGNRIRRVTGAGPSAPPMISQNGIVNGATYAGGPIAPGELITIFGSNFGASGLQVNSPVNNAIPFALGRTTVLFGGSPAAISAVTPNQINVFVPNYLGTSGTVSIQVQVDNIVSAPVYLSVVPTAIGFSSSILNQDGTVNTAANPAPRGSIVSFYGTGLGQMTPQLPDGALAIATPYSTPVVPPTITIGGQPATILYAGDAPGFPTGVFQINATIPNSISAGPASVSNQVTVSVK